ncbi:DUF6537 domain-containing protein [Streptomyces sp. FXY-T5]|uniref:DUF6537 domain-containing protein n=1 Tax=unclassified Streptomyces TaxID=2593676 RepID=UPI00359C207D
MPASVHTRRRAPGHRGAGVEGSPHSRAGDVLGSWFRPILGLLRALRRVRGTRLDVFGRQHLRTADGGGDAPGPLR